MPSATVCSFSSRRKQHGKPTEPTGKAYLRKQCSTSAPGFTPSSRRVDSVGLTRSIVHAQVAWTRLVGWSIVLRGIYMGSLILGASRQDSMGYTFIGAALNALRMSISGDAETIGVSKKGQVFFVAFPLLVALGSFATLEPSELLSP